MLTFMKATSLATVISIGLIVGQAQAATVNWGAEGGANSFISDDISFTGFNADTLVGVSGQANYNTNIGALFPVTFELDILLDGVWTNVFSDVTTGTGFLSTAISNITFAYGEVTGLRGTATGYDPINNTTPLANWALGVGFNPTIFTFDAVNPPSEVPIPAALPLLLSALGFFGFMGWRRKRMAAT